MDIDYHLNTWTHTQHSSLAMPALSVVQLIGLVLSATGVTVLGNVLPWVIPKLWCACLGQGDCKGSTVQIGDSTYHLNWQVW